jgi:hypothetical protein
VTTQQKVCKDCRRQHEAAGLEMVHVRPAPHPGPRCATHHREERNRRRKATHGRDVGRRFGITPEEYGKLFEAQGRRCAVCRRATGATKRLAVDHDHTCCPGPTSCGGCVRGLLCGPCNGMMAHARDDPEMFHRAVRYLREWPSRTAGI